MDFPEAAGGLQFCERGGGTTDKVTMSAMMERIRGYVQRCSQLACVLGLSEISPRGNIDPFGKLT